MATTTPNYGWTVPTSTDLVKDGATAIETLGDAIDASMNTALGTKKAGMVLLNTTSFSAVASQSVSDVFSATYDNYRILINVTSSANDKFRLRMRVSGADNTTSNYSNHMSLLSSASTSYLGQLATAATSFLITSADGTNSVKGVDLTIYNPFLSERSLITGIHVCSGTSGGTAYYGGTTTGALNLATSFTGFTIFPESGTATGSVSVFGVNK